MIARLLFILPPLVVGASLTRGQTPAAFVESVKGQAAVRDLGASSTHPLKEQTALFSGQRVSCANKCRELIISYCNHRIRIPVPNNGIEKLIVGYNCNPPRDERGGIRKGETSLIISPKEGERISPEFFSLKWNPPQAVVDAELSLKIYLGERIWGPQKIDASSGSYNAKSLIEAPQHAADWSNA